MARDFWINGETMVYVKGRSDSAIASLTELGLADSSIRITPNFRYDDIKVDAWGEIPPEVQFMLSDVMITMTLVHFDRSVLATCLQLSQGGAPSEGQMARAGQRLGNNQPRFGPATGSPPTGNNAGNNYIGLNLSSPVAGQPWRFYYTYLTGPPMEFPLGAERSVVTLHWRAIPYTQDPYQGGLGAYGQYLWDHTLDN